MKKLLSILLALLCLSVCAFAEEAADTGIYMTSLTDDQGHDLYDVYLEGLPDEAMLSFDESLGEEGVWQVHMDGYADVYIYIAMCDLEAVAGHSLADVEGENMEMLKAAATVDYDDPEVEILTTPSGNQYMHICEKDMSLRCVCTYFTLYKGAIVELTQYNDDFAPLTETDEAQLKSVLYAIEFCEAE